MQTLSDKEIQVIEKETSPLLAQVSNYVIKTVEDVDSASAFLKKIKDAETGIENKRLEFTAPLNQSLKAINDTFKKLKAPLLEAKMLLTNRILDWRRAEQEKIAKEEERRRKIQEAHEKQGHQVNEPVVMLRPDTHIGNSQVRKVWKWKLTDFTKLSDEFKTINGVYVNQKIREGVREIPGLEIFQEEELSIVR
jgi:hypothetical protein